MHAVVTRLSPLLGQVDYFVLVSATKVRVVAIKWSLIACGDKRHKPEHALWHVERQCYGKTKSSFPGFSSVFVRLAHLHAVHIYTVTPHKH